jgi:hypothetical protein
MIIHIGRTPLALAIGAVTIALAGCAPASDNNSPSVQYDLVVPQTPGNPGAQNAQRGAERRVAISHRFTLRLANTEVDSVQGKHLAECRKIGCTISSTSLNRSDDGRINAQSSLRIPADAYAAFATTITTPPAHVISHSETAEDKFVPMLDLEKRLEVKSALRQRLTAMLQDANTKSVADIVAVEKELAQVQGDIETATAQHNYLLTITGTVRVDISYSGQAAVVGGFDFSPVARAIDRLGPTLVNSLAALISFLAMILPWLPLAAFVLWIVRRGIRRWRRTKPA